MALGSGVCMESWHSSCGYGSSLRTAFILWAPEGPPGLCPKTAKGQGAAETDSGVSVCENRPPGIPLLPAPRAEPHVARGGIAGGDRWTRIACPANPSRQGLSMIVV